MIFKFFCFIFPLVNISLSLRIEIFKKNSGPTLCKAKTESGSIQNTRIWNSGFFFFRFDRKSEQINLYAAGLK